jgi:hypothetical protein
MQKRELELALITTQVQQYSLEAARSNGQPVKTRQPAVKSRCFDTTELRIVRPFEEATRRTN